ncbi:hypothetical protein [Cellulomonas sp. Marseille-Q8402]
MTTVQIQPARVPVEHRWCGLDRRSVPYAAVGLAVLALWARVLPWVAAKHVLTAALDLAHDLSEIAGADTPAVERSRAEIARLRGDDGQGGTP